MKIVIRFDRPARYGKDAGATEMNGCLFSVTNRCNSKQHTNKPAMISWRSEMQSDIGKDD